MARGMPSFGAVPSCSGVGPLPIAALSRASAGPAGEVVGETGTSGRYPRVAVPTTRARTPRSARGGGLSSGQAGVGRDPPGLEGEGDRAGLDQMRADCAGSRAGAIGNGSGGSFRCKRNFRMTSGSVIIAIMCRRLRHRGRHKTSSKKTEARAPPKKNIFARRADLGGHRSSSPGPHGATVATARRDRVRERPVPESSSIPGAEGVIGELVLTRMGDQRDKTLEEHEWIEHECSSPIAPRLAQAPDDLAVVAQHQPALAKRWPSHVAGQVLQRVPFARRHVSRGMQRIAARLGLQRATLQGE
jgi:hypothetical protein